jgi:KDO2-lipid IV(A) lauroyltransferase
MIGRALYRVRDKSTRHTIENIQHCFPDLDRQQQTQLVKQSLKETGALAFETCIVWSRDSHYLKEAIVKIHGEAFVHKAMQKKSGLIILAPHLGNWEVLGKHLPTYGEVTSLYQPPKYPSLEDVIKRSREKSGANLVPTNTRGVSSLLKALRKGHISGILHDQVPDDGSGEFAPFFGLPAYTMKLVQKLIEKTGCSVLVAFAERVPKGFELHFLEPDDEIYSQDLSTSLSAMNRSIEDAVSIAPAQYQWEYKRFKRRLADGSRAIEYR